MRLSFALLEGREEGCEKGGGGLSRTCLKPCFPACGEQETDTEKESACQISATWKITRSTSILHYCNIYLFLH